MEKKTKQKILGFLVLIGLVIILLPFFQKSNNIQPETAFVTAPPFPDQPAQVAAVTPPIAPAAPEEKQPLSSNDTATPVPPKTQTIAAHANAEDYAVKLEKSVIPPKKGVYKKLENKNQHDSIKTAARDEKKHESVVENKQSLAALKHAAWVIQIGSYRNKKNALRIVNQLRANGYPAFIQQTSTALGEHTRVYVGPEKKQLAARELADKLKSEMHINGLVIHYKPLTL